MFLRTAADDVVLDPTMSEQEIDSAEKELDVKEGVRGPYWGRVTINLLAKSSSQDIDEAVKEWRFTRAWCNQSACELCGHKPIKFHFEIENRITHKSLVVGSECIYQYLNIPGAPSRAILRRRLNQLRNKIRDVGLGKATEKDVTELQELQGLERELNLYVDGLGPDKQLDIPALYQELNKAWSTARQKRVHSAAFQAVTSAMDAIRKLQAFLLMIAKRSKKCDPRDLHTAIIAIMNFRIETTQGKKKLLDAMHQYLTDAFNYGRPKDLVQTLGREILAQIETAKNAEIELVRQRTAKLSQDLPAARREPGRGNCQDS